jgi:hypothetical protein
MTCVASRIRSIFVTTQPPLLQHPLRGFGWITGYAEVILAAACNAVTSGLSTIRESLEVTAFLVEGLR